MRQPRGGPELVARSHVNASRAMEVGGAGILQVSPTTYVLPQPPSANELFRNLPGKGRVKSSVYLDWLGHAGWVLRGQHPKKIAGAVLLVISVERGAQSADIDNRIKALIDLLVKHDAIDDDKNVVGFCAAWAPAASRLARVMVLPAASHTFDFHLASDRTSGGWFLHGAQQEPVNGFDVEGPADEGGRTAAAGVDLWPAGAGQDDAGD